MVVHSCCNLQLNDNHYRSNFRLNAVRYHLTKKDHIFYKKKTLLLNGEATGKQVQKYLKELTYICQYNRV